MAKTTLRKISEGVAWTSSTTVMIKVIGIVYTVVVLSNVSVYEFGLIELAMSIIPLMAIFNLAGLQPVMVADIVSYKSESNFNQMRYIFSSFVSLRILLGIVAFVILNTASIILSDSFPNEAIQMTHILSLVFLAGPIRAAVFLVLTSGHRFDLLAQIRLVEELLKLFLVYLFLSHYEFGAVGVVLAFVITDFLVAFSYIPLTRKFARTLFDGVPWSIGFFDPLYTVRHHAKWSVFQSTLHQFGQNIRPWIIQFLLGTQAVGIYAAAIGLYQHVQSLAPIGKIISPIIPDFKQQPKKLVGLLNSGVKYQTILLVFAVILSVPVLPYLIDNFFPSYQNAFPLFLLLSFTLIPDNFSRIYESVFHAFRLQKNLFYANLLKIIMIVVLLPVCVALFGMYGIALEFFLTLVVYAVSRYRVIQKQVVGIQFSFKNLYTIDDTDRIIFRKFQEMLDKNLKIIFKSH